MSVCLSVSLCAVSLYEHICVECIFPAREREREREELIERVVCVCVCVCVWIVDQPRTHSDSKGQSCCSVCSCNLFVVG